MTGITIGVSNYSHCSEEQTVVIAWVDVQGMEVKILTEAEHMSWSGGKICSKQTQKMLFYIHPVKRLNQQTGMLIKLIILR